MNMKSSKISQLGYFKVTVPIKVKEKGNIYYIISTTFTVCMFSSNR